MAPGVDDEGMYDGIPFADLPIETVICSPETEDHLRRIHRKEAVNEVDLQATWVIEAALDGTAEIDDGRARSRLTIRVTGWSPSARRRIAVTLYSQAHPPSGTWHVATAWAVTAEQEERS